MPDDVVAETDRLLADWYRYRLMSNTGDVMAKLRDALVAARVERDLARVEIERLTEQLIDARIAALHFGLSYFRVNAPAHKVMEHVGITESELAEYQADPRGFMRQKITEEESRG